MQSEQFDGTNEKKTQESEGQTVEEEKEEEEEEEEEKETVKTEPIYLMGFATR